MKIYADNRMLSLGLIGGTVSRHVGNMRDAQAQNSVYNQLNIPNKQILHFRQTHSDRIIRIASDADALSFQNQPEQEADAWLFSCGGWGAAILTADCVPLFLWDETASVFALAHCGWRGVVGQVQQDVASQFSSQSVINKNGKLFVNLNTEIILQLQLAGLNAADIKTPYYCTCGDAENFFSWRRDHVKDSLLSFVYKP